ADKAVSIFTSRRGRRSIEQSMMHKSNVWLVCCLVLFTVAPVAAQDHTMSIGIGYQFAKFNDVSFPVGASIDFEDRVVQQIALVGEVGWARNSRQQFGLNDITTHFHSAGGVRWVIRPRSRFEPFVQVLIGSERENINIEKFGSDSASAFLFQPGGGLIVHI